MLRVRWEKKITEKGEKKTGEMSEETQRSVPEKDVHRAACRLILIK